MSLFIDRYATPLTAGLFVVSAVSGTALFFHSAEGTFHEMHEWLSMVLLLPFVLHLARNWRLLLGYFRRGVLPLALAASLIVAVSFAMASGGRGEGRRGGEGGRAMFGVMRLLTQAPLSQLAPLLHTEPEALIATLRRQGFTIASASDSVEVVAKASEKAPPEVLAALGSLAPPSMGPR